MMLGSDTYLGQLVLHCMCLGVVTTCYIRWEAVLQAEVCAARTTWLAEQEYTHTSST